MKTSLQINSAANLTMAILPKKNLKSIDMKTIYLVYKTDTYHSYASRDVIGIATDLIIAIDICKQQAKKEHEKLKKDQLWNLQHILQTQGYSGEGEYQIESIETNKLL